MCGIALARTEEDVRKMLEVLEHRGKDDRRVVKCGDWWLGQNRLAIVDRGEDGAQPFVNGTAATVFSGEVYNYKEVYEVLEEKPTAKSEIRVIDKLMKEHDEFERILDGYFAIIRVDRKEDRVTLARDLFGVMPLYFVWHGTFLDAAASEKKALKALGETGRIAEVGASETLSFWEHNGAYRGDRVYDPYSLHLEKVDYEHVVFLFERAVLRRVEHAEVPVTIALSGGLDSAMVAWALKKMPWTKTREIDSITVGVDEKSDEVQNAKRLAEMLGIQWTFVRLTKEVVKEHWERVLYHLEDARENPIKLRGMLRNYFVALHSKGTVILCGEGADEIGAGYPSHERAGNGLKLEWKVLSTIRSMPAIGLDRVNKGGMAWTKEFRMPFLDRALVLYLMGCRKQLGKGVFRQMARQMGLPEFILSKPKYGVEEKNLEELAGVR